MNLSRSLENAILHVFEALKVLPKNSLRVLEFVIGWDTSCRLIDTTGLSIDADSEMYVLYDLFDLTFIGSLRN
jgi:hypothetical protein